MGPGRHFLLPVLAIIAGCSQPSFPDRPLYADLDRYDYARGSQLISNRLRTRFPTGSAGNTLTDFLKLQGMTVEHEKGESFARIKRDGFPWGSQIIVHWTEDATHRITQIDATYIDTGAP